MNWKQKSFFLYLKKIINDYLKERKLLAAGDVKWSQACDVRPPAGIDLEIYTLESGSFTTIVH